MIAKEQLAPAVSAEPMASEGGECGEGVEGGERGEGGEGGEPWMSIYQVNHPSSCESHALRSTSSEPHVTGHVSGHVLMSISSEKQPLPYPTLTTRHPLPRTTRSLHHPLSPPRVSKFTSERLAALAGACGDIDLLVEGALSPTLVV